MNCLTSGPSLLHYFWIQFFKNLNPNSKYQKICLKICHVLIKYKKVKSNFKAFNWNLKNYVAMNEQLYSTDLLNHMQVWFSYYIYTMLKVWKTIKGLHLVGFLTLKFAIFDENIEIDLQILESKRNKNFIKPIILKEMSNAKL